jgi:predicted secreted protein
MANNGQTVPVSTGETIAVLLPQCSGCGSAWQQTVAPEPTIVRYNSTSFNSSAAPGSNTQGTQEFDYVSVGTGFTTIRLDYMSPGSNSTPQQTFTLGFDVGNASGSSGSNNNATPPIVFLGSGDSGRTVALTRGEQAQVTLQNCSTCGNAWQQTQGPSSSIVNFDGSTSQGSSQSFNYHGVGVGQTTIVIQYFPSGSQTATDYFSVTFSVS